MSDLQQEAIEQRIVVCMTTTPFDQLAAFQAVAQARSFTAAARRLAVDKSQVSRAVTALERSLGRALLVRTTRSVTLTREGEALFLKVTPLLAGLHEALSAVPDRDQVPAGTVTLTTTPELARVLVAPALATFRQQYPLVRVRLRLGPEVVDLLGADVDLALRVGRPGSTAVLARKVGVLEAGFFAAPGYLERRGRPETVEELARHDGLWPRPPAGGRTFGLPGVPRPPAPAIECDDFTALAELARHGAGIALLPSFVATPLVVTGALTRVLPAVSLAPGPLYLLARPARPQAPRVRALSEWLVTLLRR
jgi:DNA-binding transcriptional LysR family regulator